jgi:hypothetical protein
VLNWLSSKFYQFVFPIEASLHCKIKKLRRVKNGAFSCDACISVIQNAEIMMEIDMSFSVMNKEYLNEKESLLAAISLGKKLRENDKRFTQISSIDQREAI